MPTINLPNFKLRDYQRPMWNYLERGGKRAVAVWHRRAGKDELALHWAAVAAHLRVGNYWHMLPVADQARKAIWEAVNPETGKRRIDEAFPPEIRKHIRNDFMRIELKNGSTWQVVGSDNYENLIGAGPCGIVWSEWAKAKPASWDFLRPILRENGGWALFIYTPRGRNHGYDLYEMAARNDQWFAQLLGVKDTGREYLRDEEIKDGMSEEMAEQEYDCSFAGVAAGYYYARALEALRAGRRLRTGIYQPGRPVHTAWDIGLRDDTAVWFYQKAGPDILIIDYYEANGYQVPHYAQMLQRKTIERGYIYGDHWMPHDAVPASFISEKSAIQQMADLGFKMTPCPRLSVQDGINAVRIVLPRCYFEEEACAKGLKALGQYEHEWDEDKKTFRDKPLHNWASHAADAFRYLAVAYQDQHAPETKPPQPWEDMTLDQLWKLRGEGEARI